MKSNVFSASVLEEATPMTFLGPFGFRSGRDIDSVDLGTHTVFIGNVVSSEVLKEGNPLTYQYYHTVLNGKSPPNAPTFEA